LTVSRAWQCEPGRWHCSAEVAGWGDSMWAVSGLDALQVGEVPGPRWQIALQLLRDGGPTVLVQGEARVGLQRWVGWPRADGKIHIYFWTVRSPSTITVELAEADVRTGLAVVGQLLGADSRLGRLFDEFGVCYEYLYDYGQGAAKIADVASDGTVSML